MVENILKRLSKAAGESWKKLSETAGIFVRKISLKAVKTVKGIGDFFPRTLRTLKKDKAGKSSHGFRLNAGIIPVLILLVLAVSFAALNGSGLNRTEAGKSEGSKGSNEQEKNQVIPESDANGVIEYDSSVQDNLADKSSDYEGSNDIFHSLFREIGPDKDADDLLSTALRSAVKQTKPVLGQFQKDMEEALRAEYRAVLDSGRGASFIPSSKAQKKFWDKVRKQRREELAENPYLLLVNKWNYQPDGYEVDPVELPNGQSISRDCLDALTKMLEDCAAAGNTPIVCSGYRPHWYQVNLFNEQTEHWLNNGYGQEEAEALAATAVAIPGTSEHELGLAADIYSSENMNLDESQLNTSTQQWLMENCWRYGFILRYPQGKSEITGIIFEPWHYRYVGIEHAEKIMKAGICLEEYLDAGEHE